MRTSKLDSDFMDRVLEYRKAFALINRRAPRQKELAAHFGVSESSMSRAFSRIHTRETLDTSTSPKPKAVDAGSKCGSCRWWNIMGYVGPNGERQCRRIPPTLVLDNAGRGSSYWPLTKSTYWCGEYKIKE